LEVAVELSDFLVGEINELLLAMLEQPSAHL
jgi:hypothetical protein